MRERVVSKERVDERENGCRWIQKDRKITRGEEREKTKITLKTFKNI